jgi:hypothetical protein
MSLQSKLKSVPAITKQELFFYIVEHVQDISICIVTQSGRSHSGRVLSVGNVRLDDTLVTLQILEANGKLSNTVLHISIHSIESVELLGKENDILKILSLGKVTKNEIYQSSGKLEVSRALKSFADSILKHTSVDVGVPEMILPTDGVALGRILKLTETIETVLIDLLKDKDANESWRQSYNKMSFVNAEALEVTPTEKIVQIAFPFSDLNESEIDAKELTAKLMSIL